MSIPVANEGTSEGAKKAWETRKAGSSVDAEVSSAEKDLGLEHYDDPKTARMRAKLEKMQKRNRSMRAELDKRRANVESMKSNIESMKKELGMNTNCVSRNPIVRKAINAFNANLFKGELNKMISLVQKADKFYQKCRELRDKTKYKLPRKDEDIERILSTTQDALRKIETVVVNSKGSVDSYNRAKEEYMKCVDSICKLAHKIQDYAEDNLDVKKNRSFMSPIWDLEDYCWSLGNSLRSFEMSASQYKEMMNEPDRD